ncbi:glycosyl hydrolase [Pseudomaricurvus alkylphenolicus]|uniref:beta-L-arabinofuranosidase domain-containing protein n=1 Tax=Pseudomaricurvus alkylphenolicus TaxID=1306991 RepID=UPI00142138D0|nr:beta-L-arabinofuranosidase domain-containing protein [Pseudomaricurvus alkylphenolicus]NIB38123.1 glycosyl hydrolase [Pseudomaricurvus alkylphenolicus]
MKKTQRFRKPLFTHLPLALSVAACQPLDSQTELQATYRIISPPAQTFEWLQFGEVKPRGWIRQQMEQDLTEGFVGQLDKLVPDLIHEDDIYGKDRLTRKVKSKDVGTVSHDAEWEVQYLWWNSETQSNWWDGLVRTALLTNNRKFLDKVDAYVERMLSYQDDDGYLGIYAPDLRYNFSGENGELWAQSSLFRVLLGYYEATGKDEVLTAVERAVAVTMHHYPIGESTPFKVEKPFAGVGHGLTFTDTLDRLYQLTGKREYMDYALWLYQDYNQHDLEEVDIHYDNLMNPDYRFKGHGVHTYEHLRSLVTAYYASGNPQLKAALDAYLEKLDTVLTPSGGPIGDEWVAHRHAHASDTGYEYCSIHELLASYTQLLQKEGTSAWADRIEWLLFNAGQGARHPEESAIAYCKTDNSLSMEGKLHSHGPDDPGHAQTRFKYSPVHKDVAVCCVPNAGRIYPYFVNSMWLRHDRGLVASLYGPSEVDTEVNGVGVKILESTNYPFEFGASFTISVEEPVNFEILLRKPAWMTDMELNAAGAEIDASGEYIRLQKTWQNGDRIDVQFEADVQQHQDLNNDYYLSHGPLVYALPLSGEETVTKTFPLDGFHNFQYAPATPEQSGYQYVTGSAPEFKFSRAPLDPQKPWATELSLTGALYNNTTRDLETVNLVPIGNTILRKVTFEASSVETADIQ